MKLEEELVEEDKREGRIRREFKDLKSIFKAAIGYKPSKEEQERNKNTWEGKLIIDRPCVACGIILTNLAIAVSGFVYTGITLVEYFKNLYTS